MRKRSLADAMRVGVRKKNFNECWPWEKNKTKSGYGVVWDGKTGKNLRAHRVAYAMAFLDGKLPNAQLVVMHKCDNPECCNPSHLLLGTQADNVADRTSKRRGKGFLEGDGHIMSKLTEDDVVNMRADTKRGRVARAVRKYGITKSTASAVLKRKTWKHVP